nr:PREDICTED: uncharacterized protein LOC109042163 isoform X2 [Bemisia tabaci]
MDVSNKCSRNPEEDTPLIDLEKPDIEKVDKNPPLIPAPSTMVNPDNNPFDAVAELTKQDPFEMVLQKAFSEDKSTNTNIEVHYDLVSLDDSDENNSTTNGVTPKYSKTSNLVPSNVNSGNDSKNDSFYSPIMSQNQLQVTCYSKNNGNSLEGSDELSSKKSSTSINISALSSLHCISANSNNECENSVFLGDSLSSDQNIKEFVAARIQNVIKKTLNKSFSGFDQKKDLTTKGRSTAKSVSTVDGWCSPGRNETRAVSDYSSKSYGSMNQGFLKTTASLTSDNTFNEISETAADDLKAPSLSEKYKVNSSLFRSPPVEILREATRLSRSFSVGSTDYANLLDNNEDLLSIKPKWETLDSDSDGDGSDDSFKSLRLNIRPASISTPPQRMLDSESLQKYKKRLSLLSSAEPTPEKETHVKQRSRSADRAISDSALKQLSTKLLNINLQPALPISKLEDAKLRPKNPEPEKTRRGPMKALVPLKNMLRGKDSSSTKANSPTQKASTAKKSSIKPTSSSTPKRNRKPLAENNAQNSPTTSKHNRSPLKHRRSNSYQFKNFTPENKASQRSSSASRAIGGIKPPTPISKLPGLIQGSPKRTREECGFSPKSRIATPTFKGRLSLCSGKENVNHV